MAKRVLLVAIIVAATLVVAAPALAFNGYRGDYTLTTFCAVCHTDGTVGPAVYNQWSESAHAVSGADGQATRLPYGSSCAGCHTSNYDPSKVVPTPTATSTSGAVSWGAVIPSPFPAQNDGNTFISENFVGCSSCHYGKSAPAQYGNDPNNTAHAAPFGNLADADVCGQCHSRYAYTVGTYTVASIPDPNPTTLLQPQYSIGYKMLGEPTSWTPAGLATVLNIPAPGWSPTPNPAATSAGFGQLQTYWKDAAGNDMLWQQTGHDGSAAQYPEWKSEGHANALTALGPNPQASCLKCHSADYRIAVEAGKTPPTGAQAKYGITCVGCHKPHDAGTAKGVWDEAFDTQLITDNGKTLCVECHNGEIPASTTASPGAEVHHPMKEMMDGYGAIDVASFPSVHKGKCVQCHMPPTSYSRGSVQLGGNHTFNIITPETAVDASPIPVSTVTAKATALPLPGTTNYPVITTTVTTTQASMPYSACSTCHDNNAKAAQVITATTATPTPTASPLLVNVTVLQQAAGGDKGLWLQNTIDQRQEWTKAKIVEIHAALAAAAVRLGYADESAAHTALVTIPAARRTTDQTTFLKAFTNVGYVESEGSFGIHNWDYSRAIVNTALVEAQSVKTAPKPWRITFKISKARVAVNHKVKFSGTVKTSAMAPGAGVVTIQKKVKGHWKAWRTAKLKSTGGFAKTVKMTKKGTFYFRAFMPAHGSNLKKASKSHRLVVK